MVIGIGEAHTYMKFALCIALFSKNVQSYISQVGTISAQLNLVLLLLLGRLGRQVNIANFCIVNFYNFAKVSYFFTIPSKELINIKVGKLKK